MIFDDRGGGRTLKDTDAECAVVLLSGGMDSATLLAYARARLGVRRLRAVSYFYGQRHARELEMARWQARQAAVEEHRIVDMSFYANLIHGASVLTDESAAVPDFADLPEEVLAQPPTYVPHRNLILLALAAGYAESVAARTIFYGAQAQDRYGYWDCTPEFVEKLNGVLSLNRRTPVDIQAPFAGLRKAEVLRIGLELGVDYAHTWTCYRGGGQPCGLCPSCVERTGAFKEAGVPDPAG